jgi:hypothetical protein
MSRRTRIWLIVFISAVVLGLGFPIVNAFFFIGVFVPDLMLGSLWVFAGLSMLSLGFSILIDRGKLRPMMWCGIIATWLASIGWLTMIWSELSESQVMLWVWWSVMLNGQAIAILLIGILGQLRIPLQWGIVMRRVTTTLLILLGLFGSATICWSVEVEFFWSSHRNVVDWQETAARLSGVLAILTGCGLGATILATVVPNLHDQEVPDSQRLRFAAECPRCTTRQELRTHGDACRQCGLQVKVVPT